MADRIHEDQPIRTAGTPLAEADAAVLMIHGRGAGARSILGMAGQFDVEGVAYLAPEADGRTWYPNSFLAPRSDNEPWLSSALSTVGERLEEVTDAGVDLERTLLMGFSQGGCLAAEYVARNPRRYGGLAALSGGLIGEEVPDDYEGSLAGTPAFLGCSDQDPHIPLERVHETADVLTDLDAQVDERIYEGMAHTVNDDELAAVASLIAGLGEA